MTNAESSEITGRWAQQPNEMIDIDYLLVIFECQLQGWPRQFEGRKWHALPVKLGLILARVLCGKIRGWIFCLEREKKSSTKASLQPVQGIIHISSVGNILKTYIVRCEATYAIVLWPFSYYAPRRGGQGGAIEYTFPSNICCNAFDILRLP